MSAAEIEPADGPVNPDTGEITAPADFRLSWEPMNAEQATQVTTQINAYSVRLPLLIREARDAGAWKALGCATWTEYVEEHLVISTEYARLLLRGADKLEELAEGTGVPVEMFSIPERVLRGMDTPTMVGVGREAIAALPTGTPVEEQAEAVDEAVREKLAAQKLEEAAQRGREKAASDMAEAEERRRIAAAEALAERQRQDEERAARKAAANAKAPTSPAPAPVASDPQQEAPSPAAGTPEGTPTPAEPGDVDEDLKEDGTGLASQPVEGPEDATPPAPPVLPDDWRKRIGDACYLTRLDPALLLDALSIDDALDLKDLHAYLTDLLANQEPNP